MKKGVRPSASYQGPRLSASILLLIETYVTYLIFCFELRPHIARPPGPALPSARHVTVADVYADNSRIQSNP